MTNKYTLNVCWSPYVAGHMYLAMFVLG